jgi:hypothetical protein
MPRVAVTVEEARRMLVVGGPELEHRWPEVIGLCSADPAARAELADLQARAAELEEEVAGAGWIALILRVLHEAPFVAIELDTRRGIAGRMSGVADNFQLHTLLMDTFPGGPRVPAEIAANARGEGPQDLGETVTGAWNLYTYRAVPGGQLPDTSDESVWPFWIWGEGVPADIPELDGHRVIVLGPPPYARNWNAARVFAGMRASLDARELARDEVDAWIAKL